MEKNGIEQDASERQLTILVVEDTSVQRLALTNLVRRLGHNCVEAQDGYDGLQICQKGLPDVIICDLEMPRMNGLEMCQQVRSLPSQTYPYFIFLSAHHDLNSVVDGMRAGADDYLGKPVKLIQLEACLIAAERVTSLHKALAARGAELERLNQQLYEQSRIDPLTRLWNRLAMAEDLKALQDRVRRYDALYCFALLDVDHFKKYNDTYGHQAGDKALSKVAELIGGTIRSSDRAYRYGGEEFLITLSDQTTESSLHALERIRRLVEAEAIPHAPSEMGVVTVSCGIAQFGPGRDCEGEDVLQAADRALYRAKEAGRNTVVLAPFSDASI
jgi:diguanylate cyclase (GGDEF)-like protein